MNVENISYAYWYSLKLPTTGINMQLVCLVIDHWHASSIIYGLIYPSMGILITISKEAMWPDASTYVHA